MSAMLPGGDSATPKPDRYAGHKVWGVYVAGATYHVWTKAEVRATAQHGIEGVLPIVVPSQTTDWWLTNHGYAELEQLAREAVAWGIPKGSPLCLDIEEHQAAKMMAPGDVAHAWAVACSTHGLIPWCYGPAPFLQQDHYTNRWLAYWPFDTPKNPEVPAGYRGWQYKGNTNGIDLNVFRTHEIFLSPELKPVTLLGTSSPHAHALAPSDGGSSDVQTVLGTPAAPSPTPATKNGVIDASTSPSNEVNTLDALAGSVPDRGASAPPKGAVQVSLTIPTKSQLAVFIAEAGALLVFANDFVKQDHITGWPLAGLNAAAVLVTTISHWNNKRKAATQSKTPVA